MKQVFDESGAEMTSRNEPYLCVDTFYLLVVSLTLQMCLPRAFPPNTPPLLRHRVRNSRHSHHRTLNFYPSNCVVVEVVDGWKEATPRPLETSVH